ncbi:hypothetical protein [Bradyrhizobium canariense]|uniref:DUF308 domain-containing protein n=1 Tax=Bradyrhizobium canariense TaxID=255045 RepID=A0A1H1TGP5_9BRAD|nr:hypothetical protein [Bradyrhizobium canariense]SDS59324.1 hypothetical protein SAMN05444158_2539 [Bradyrhizobium canariense]
MIIVLLIAGIAFLLAGLAGIALGIPVKEFSFGNTLILAGVISACTGIVTLCLSVVVRELQAIGVRLGSDVTATQRAMFPTPLPAANALRDKAPENAGFPFSRDQAGAARAGDAEPTAASPPPWHEETAVRDRVRNEAPPLPEPATEALSLRQRRNLLFSSTSRKERERVEGRINDPAEADSHPASGAGPSKSSEVSSATFEDAWPQSERGRAADAPPQWRGGRTPSTFTEAGGAPGTGRQAPTAGNEEQSGVAVLKSGVVDGMAYSLYSDGSIEAQMPEGMMRFASIDELRAHLDQRS